MTLFGDTPADVRRTLGLLGVLAIVWPFMLAITLTEALGGGRCDR